MEIGVEDAPPVEANPLRVEQVLTNLLDNADKDSPAETNARIEAQRDDAPSDRQRSSRSHRTTLDTGSATTAPARQ